MCLLARVLTIMVATVRSERSINIVNIFINGGHRSDRRYTGFIVSFCMELVK